MKPFFARLVPDSSYLGVFANWNMHRSLDLSRKDITVIGGSQVEFVGHSHLFYSSSSDMSLNIDSTVAECFVSILSSVL